MDAPIRGTIEGPAEAVMFDAEYSWDGHDW
jgi:hypothetical protein